MIKTKILLFAFLVSQLAFAGGGGGGRYDQAFVCQGKSKNNKNIQITILEKEGDFTGSAGSVTIDGIDQNEARNNFFKEFSLALRYAQPAFLEEGKTTYRFESSPRYAAENGRYFTFFLTTDNKTLQTSGTQDYFAYFKGEVKDTAVLTCTGKWSN